MRPVREQPPIVVLTVPALADLGRDFVPSLLLAPLPGWTCARADVDATRADAVSSARHQARLRGESFELLVDEPGEPALVSIGRRLFQLIVVAYEKTS